jgi:hypothetical protein
MLSPTAIITKTIITTPVATSGQTPNIRLVEGIEDRGDNRNDRQRPDAQPLRDPEDGEGDREQDAERPWLEDHEDEHESRLRSELPRQRRQSADPVEGRQRQHGIAERVVDEEEEHRECELQADRDPPPSFLAKPAPPIPEALPSRAPKRVRDKCPEHR